VPLASVTLPRHWPWLAATVLIVAAGLTFNLAGYPLLDPDEGRNAEVMREMASTNDYVLPHLNGLPYIDKPALYFVVGGLVMEVLGPKPLAARLPSLLFTIATLIVVAWFARRLFGPEAVGPAVVATAATPFTLAYSRTVIFDSALTFWTVVAVAGFFLAVEPGTDTKEERGGWRALSWAALGLGVLTKGPIALALPLMVAVPYALWRRRVRALLDPIAVLLFVAIVLPWVFAVSREVPGFLHHALVTETVRRLTTTELGRTGPGWYFLVILPAATLPWSIVTIAGGWARRRPAGPVDPRILLLLLWIAVPLVFFSLSQSKRPQYILPLVPAVGLLVGALWTHAHGKMPGVRPAAFGLALLGAFLVLARGNIADWVPARPDVAAQIPATAVALGAALLVASVGAWWGAAHRWVALMALSLPVAAVPFSSVGLMRAIGHERSTEELARMISASAGRATQVVGVSAFPASLPFYLDRTITLSTADGSELTSNYLVRGIDRWRAVPGSTLRDPDWWRDAVVTCPRPTVFVAKTDDAEASSFLAEALPLIAATRMYSAYGPCGHGLLARGTR
jgi:4-amino-4-deoxy-L-arabinose transferase-like glycosyltransferase